MIRKTETSVIRLVNVTLKDSIYTLNVHLMLWVNVLVPAEVQNGWCKKILRHWTMIIQFIFVNISHSMNNLKVSKKKFGNFKGK